jgi:hypothetical protein
VSFKTICHVIYFEFTWKCSYCHRS